MIIRRANEYEINQLMLWSVSFTEEMSMGYMKSSSHLTYEMATNVLSKGGYYLVAQHGRNIMGWILLGTDYNYYKKEAVGFLYELYVFPQYRKKGIGKVLIERAIAELKKAGMTKVQLNVFAGNHAKMLYENIGFNDVTILMEKNIGLQ
ncbi:GNAT family N-acetyltransferase [Schinkia sp. CFF1]